MKVMGRNSLRTVDVAADGIGLSSRSGTALLALTAQRLGLADGLSAALAPTRERRSAHDPGRVGDADQFRLGFEERRKRALGKVAVVAFGDHHELGHGGLILSLTFVVPGFHLGVV